MGYLLWASIPFVIGLVMIAAGLAIRARAPKSSYGSMRDQGWAAFVFALCIGGGAVSLLAAGVGGQLTASSKGCERKGRIMDLEWDYSAWTGCLVRLPDGRWIDPSDVENEHITGGLTIKGGDE